MAANPFPLPHDGNPWWVADCHHGRVLVAQHNGEYAVWDPITGHRQELPHTPVIRHEIDNTAAVLCAVAGCDHRDCWGGPLTPFKVIFLSIVDHPLTVTVHACVYSSEARAWSTPVSALTGSRSGSFQYKRGALVGDVYYCNIGLGDIIVKFELGSHTLSMIDPPQKYDDGSLLMAEEGSLGLAGISGSSLYLWSRMLNPEGIAEWVQQRVIELDQLLLPFGKSLYRVNVSALAEGVRFIIMTCGGDVFMFDKKLWRVRKVMKEPEEHYSVIFPFVCFYKPDSAAANCHCQRRQL
ncbi:hypothetical protein QOZ80_7BG0585120 [Eleusine coracana subsp. coracana]|nr:hypothetical protein QOZ80_7BG0585120 [Eleusine coracana subsp. coracana]